MNSSSEPPDRLDKAALTTGDTGDDAIIGRAFRRSVVVILVVVIAIGAFCSWKYFGEGDPDRSIRPEIGVVDVRELPPVELPDLPYTDITAEAGIIFLHENGAYGDKLLPETMGGGCAFFDFDNDGDQDILLVNSKRWPWDSRPPGAPTRTALYRNNGSGSFKDISQGSGLDVSLYGQGVAVGDYDNDGRVDVYLSAVGPNRLFRNLGHGKFEDVTAKARVAGDSKSWSTSCGWVDYNNDGNLDLFVCNYLEWSRTIDLGQNCALRGIGRGYCRPQDFRGTFSGLYRNDGNGVFTDVSMETGIRIVNPDSGEPLGKSLGVTFGDFNNDASIDIVVANDTVQNFLFESRPSATFHETGAAIGIAFDTNGDARGAMGIDSAYFRNNSEIGIAIGNYSNEMTALYVSPEGTYFTDEAVSNGLGPATRLELTFGLAFVDCDLDGRLDLVASNGHLEEDINKVLKSQHYEQSPQLLWNCGAAYKTEFLPASGSITGPDFARPMVGRGLSYADIDGDGDLDLLLTATGGAPRLLRNDQSTGHHWLRLKLIGSTSNRDAIGARIEVHMDGFVKTQAVMPTRSYLSQTELPLTFGLGNTNAIQKVVVHWPSGATTELPELPVDASHRIHEAHGLLRTPTN